MAKHDTTRIRITHNTRPMDNNGLSNRIHHDDEPWRTPAGLGVILVLAAIAIAIYLGLS